MNDTNLVKLYNEEFSGVSNIPTDEVCLVCLGGEHSNDIDDMPKRYATMIDEQIIKSMGFNIPVYSAYYDYTTKKGPAFARELHFSNYHNKRYIKQYQKHFDNIKEKAEEEDYNPKYIQNLYKSIIEPRISKNNGTERISKIDACKNIRKLLFIPYCHGAFVMTKMEEIMSRKMNELGYIEKETDEVMKQMLSVAVSPACYIGNKKSTFISFMSILDSETPTTQNIFKFFFFDSDTNEAKNFKLGFFKAKKSNLFLVDQRAVHSNFFCINKEHRLSFSSSDKTEQGKKILMFAKNIIANGLNNSLEQNSNTYKPLPELEKLILNPFDRNDTYALNLFKDISAVGENTYKKIIEFATIWNPENYR